jgi:methionyl-tRNA formyltransferase
MSNQIDIVFLGINDAGMQIYEWLCNRKSVLVHSLLTTKDQLQVIKNIKPDYVVSCGYRHIVPEDILNVPTEGCLNLHPAYLPYNRGANPNVWSIVEDTPAGVTLHWMNPDLDTGDIIARKKVETEFSDSGKELYQRLEDAQVTLFQEVWPEIVNGKIDEIEQDADAGTYHRTEDFEELCQLDPDEEVRVKDFLDRLRALTFPPYDNAKIEVDGETYYVEIDISK